MLLSKGWFPCLVFSRYWLEICDTEQLPCPKFLSCSTPPHTHTPPRVPSNKCWDSRPILIRPWPLPQPFNSLLRNYCTI